METNKELNEQEPFVDTTAQQEPEQLDLPAEMPSMEELYGHYGAGKLEILAINVDDDGPAAMPGFLQENPHTFPILFDTDFQARTLYGVSMFPETFIVDQNGIIVKKIVGAIDWTSPQMLNYLNSLMGAI